MFRRRRNIFPGGGSGLPAGAVVNAVLFDGTNDLLNLDAALTGAVDGENFLASLWINMQGGNTDTHYVYELSVTKVALIRLNNGKINFSIRSSAGILWNMTTVALYDTGNNPGWHHLLIAGQFDVTPIGQIYIDDVAASITESTAPANGNIQWDNLGSSVGARDNDGLNKLFGDLAEVYITNEYLDIDVEVNRRKFIDAAGKPVNLGSDGSTPTGSIPLMFFSGDTVDWHTNKGSGSGFTEVGALTDATSSPSD